MRSFPESQLCKITGKWAYPDANTHQIHLFFLFHVTWEIGSFYLSYITCQNFPDQVSSPHTVESANWGSQLRLLRDLDFVHFVFILISLFNFVEESQGTRVLIKQGVHFNGDTGYLSRQLVQIRRHRFRVHIPSGYRLQICPLKRHPW